MTARDTATGNGNGLVGVGVRDLAELIEDLSDAILVVSPDGEITRVNAAAEDLFGKDRSLLVGQPFGHPVAAGAVSDLDIIRRDARPRVVEMRCAETRSEGRTEIVCSLRDITDRKRAEESRQRFMTTASHEYLTPLTSITGYVSLLRENFHMLEPEAIRDFLRNIETQAARLKRMAQEILEVGRLEQGGMEAAMGPVALAPAVGEAITAVNDLQGVASAVDADLRVFADPEHLHEMLVNYLGNAAAYGRRPMEVYAQRADDMIDIIVGDSGGGVPTEIRARLFEPFTRGHVDEAGHRRGNGLGLAIVSELARGNGGRAWYRPGRLGGAEFGVTLRAVPATRMHDDA